MLKSIVFGPFVPFESLIASASEPGPSSLLFVTTNVVGISRFSRSWKTGRKGGRFVRLAARLRRLILRPFWA